MPQLDGVDGRFSFPVHICFLASMFHKRLNLSVQVDKLFKECLIAALISACYYSCLTATEARLIYLVKRL